ncbi:MAG: hypothetical protein AAGF04_05485 [Chlamydiota bacterium]
MLFLERCIHCDCPSTTLFCSSCQTYIEYLHPQRADAGDLQKSTLFSSWSPLVTLYKEMERGRLHYYLSGFVALLQAQLIALCWPIEYLFVPSSLLELLRGALLPKIGVALARTQRWRFLSKVRFRKKTQKESNTLILCKGKEGASEAKKDRPNCYLLQIFDQDEATLPIGARP